MKRKIAVALAVAFNPATGQPEDSAYQAESARIPPQTHY